jgi:hypothetical protein
MADPHLPTRLVFDSPLLLILWRPSLTRPITPPIRCHYVSMATDLSFYLLYTFSYICIVFDAR